MIGEEKIMKVILLNGSPKAKGCTFTALSEVAEALEKNGIETEIFHVGTEAVRGCMACGSCSKLGKCAYEDSVNRFVEKAKTADGFVIGSPVHYAAASGAITSFLDRAFYSGKPYLEYKPGAAIVSCRRAGSTAALDQLTKYFTISNMPVVSSQYWAMVHGSNPEQVKQDLEGMQTMRVLGSNMAWLLKVIEAGDKAGINKPEKEDRVFTNFIRS